MNRRKFLGYLGCGCCSMFLPSCATAPITERKQLRIISEAKLNAQAAAIYEKVKKKEKMSNDKKTLNDIKKIGSKIEAAICEYFYQSNIASFSIYISVNQATYYQLNLNVLKHLNLMFFYLQFFLKKEI